MTQQLAGTVVVITGASSGIGAATARLLGRRGARLVLAARDDKALDKIADEVRVAGGEALSVATDLGDGAQVRSLAEQTLAHYDRIDALVNNAGIGQYGPLAQLSEARIRSQFEINVFAPLLLTQQFFPAMRAQKRGRIVNVSSVAGIITLPFGGLYHASKHALESLSDALRMELAPFGIFVSLVEPGPIDTEFFDKAEDVVAQYNLQDSPYAPVIPRLRSLLEFVDQQGQKPEAVTETIASALGDPTPQDRYVVSPGGAPVLALLKNLPTPLSDYLYKELFGLNQSLG